MTETTMLEMRQRRAQALIPTVRRVDAGYRVSSGSHDIEYLITKPNGKPICTCPDFQRHADQPDFQCKHILAVTAAYKEGRLQLQNNGNSPPESTSPVSAGELHILHRYLSNEDPVRLKLIKNTKGYSWEISVAQPDPETALSTLRDIEQRVKAEFGGLSDEPSP